jgi:predicted PurR-regulated permease PerM
VLAAALYALLWLVGQLLVVVIPVAVAILLTRALLRPTVWLHDRGVPESLAAAVVLFAFLAITALMLVGVGANIAGEIDQLGTTVSEGIDDVETWLVEDGPFDLDRDRVEDLRDQAGDRVADMFASSGGTIRSGALLAVEFAAGIVLALIVTFFVLKDHQKMVGLGLRAVRPDRRAELRALGEGAGATHGGYLRGVAILGIIEAVIIGRAGWVVGGQLAVAVAVVTLLGAFVPLVGAIVAGLVAVLVTLVTAGPGAAAIIAVVALVVQQLDNDVLAPVIYGKSLQLHPLVILLGIAAGSALFGFVGVLLAVPVISVLLNVLDESRNPTIERIDAHDDGQRAADVGADARGVHRRDDAEN